MRTLLIFLIISNVTFGQSYSDSNPKGIAFAKKSYSNHKESFISMGKELGLSSSFIFSIVAPEISNYSSFTNLCELNALKLIYLQGGSEYGNFSVGQFQMKPSFIEKLEKTIADNHYLNKKYAYIVLGSENRNTRKIRLSRLESFNWQMKYLQVFCEIMQGKKTHFSNSNEKLQFYATAYNTGFHKSISSIEAEYNKNRFPAVSNKKYNYSDIALMFYKCL